MRSDIYTYTHCIYGYVVTPKTNLTSAGLPAYITVWSLQVIELMQYCGLATQLLIRLC